MKPMTSATIAASEILARLTADVLHPEDQLPGVEHAPEERYDRDPSNNEKCRGLTDGNADGSGDRDRKKRESSDELHHRDATVETHARRAETASRGRGKGNAGGDIQREQLDSERRE